MCPSENLFPKLIASLAKIKSDLSQVDDGLWPYRFPRVAADFSTVADVEKCLGYPLPISFREFLCTADGWPCFFQTIDLFGCGEFLGNRYRQIHNDVIASIRSEEWQRIGMDCSKLIIFGATSDDRDVWLFDTTMADASEYQVYWFAGQIVDQWNSFVDFFKSMIEYNRLELNHFLSSSEPLD